MEIASPTRRELTREEVEAAARVAFGVGVADAAPMDGGSFGAVWRVALADGRDTVLKAAPKPGARLLRYEAGLLAAEAEHLRLVARGAPGVPMARCLAADDEHLFMTVLPGTPMCDLPEDADRDRVRRQLGAAIAAVHGIRGDRFGYTTGGRASGDTWADAFAGMVDELLDDAEELGVTVPHGVPALRAVPRAHATALGRVSEAVPLHFDLWDGNVLVGPDGDLSGIVDGERWLWGDPLLDFVSTAIFRSEVDEAFTAGYRSVRPIDLDPVRLDLYRLHLYLVMLVEEPTRGITAESDPWRHGTVRSLVTDIAGRLGAGAGRAGR